MIKRFHEAPISIFDKVQQVTDGDYFLVHLYESHPEYLAKFYKARHAGRETILDNSIFELGTAFDMHRFAKWVERTTPTWYIVPDVLENRVGTVVNLNKWNSDYSDLPSKKIAVAQGKTYEDFVECYSYIKEAGNVDMIAISFDYSFYEKLVPSANKYVSWSLGRVATLGRMLQDGIIDKSKPHHLLGVALPFEGLLYKANKDMYNWLYSIDTSNPVVHGIRNIAYVSNQGLLWKESQKLHELINYPEQSIDWELVQYNIKEFAKLWS
jgi:hypothetical protein